MHTGVTPTRITHVGVLIAVFTRSVYYCH